MEHTDQITNIYTREKKKPLSLVSVITEKTKEVSFYVKGNTVYSIWNLFLNDLAD
nr:hypothetical protein [uncultured Caproiciproducens sp.]